MKQTITRTIKTTIVEFAVIDFENGEPTINKQPSMKFTGELNKKQVSKELKNKFDEPYEFTIINIDYVTKTYEMTVQEFIENAKEITKEEK